jgi:hypothetical protein
MCCQRTIVQRHGQMASHRSGYVSTPYSINHMLFVLTKPSSFYFQVAGSMPAVEQGNRFTVSDNKGLIEIGRQRQKSDWMSGSETSSWPTLESGKHVPEAWISAWPSVTYKAQGWKRLLAFTVTPENPRSPVCQFLVLSSATPTSPQLPWQVIGRLTHDE